MCNIQSVLDFMILDFMIILGFMIFSLLTDFLFYKFTRLYDIIFGQKLDFMIFFQPNFSFLFHKTKFQGGKFMGFLGEVKNNSRFWLGYLQAVVETRVIKNKIGFVFASDLQAFLFFEGLPVVLPLLRLASY